MHADLGPINTGSPLRLVFVPCGLLWLFIMILFDVNGVGNPRELSRILIVRMQLVLVAIGLARLVVPSLRKCIDRLMGKVLVVS